MTFNRAYLVIYGLERQESLVAVLGPDLDDVAMYERALETALMEATTPPESCVAYAECAAAQYTLIRGYGFARHLRTNVYETGGVWTADAVYTVSPSLPRGVRQIDAEVVAANCAENGIPMV